MDRSSIERKLNALDRLHDAIAKLASASDEQPEQDPA